MQGIVEVKRWINLTGVEIQEKSLGVVIAPSNHIIDHVQSLSERAIAKKLRSGIGTIVDLGVAINYSGKCSIWYPDEPKVTGSSSVSCRLKCAVGVGFKDWKYVGELTFAQRLRTELVPTMNDGIRRILKAVSQYYPGEHSAADFQLMAMQVSASFTPDEMAVALHDPRAMAALCQKVYKNHQRSKNTGRGLA